MHKILVCDDEKDIVSAIHIYLSAEGYQTVCCYNAAQAKEALEHHSDIDLLLLDIMMPGMNGLELTTRLRQHSNIPIILLTAKSEDADKVLGLTVGADDYITKPFVPIELLARVRSQLRRYHTLGGASKNPNELIVGGIVADTASKTVTVDGTAVNLTKTEYALLEIFMRAPGRIFSPDELYEKLHGCRPFAANNTVAVHIRHLREKIEINPNEPRYLTIVWGQGYRINDIKMK